jgi:ferredoxin--NADP+ reductase
VTDYLREHPADPAWLCYLCGNCDMIYEAFDILRSQLFAEVYF